jgi:hypothetical protein
MGAVTYLIDTYVTLSAVMGAFRPVSEFALVALGVGFPLSRL